MNDPQILPVLQIEADDNKYNHRKEEAARNKKGAAFCQYLSIYFLFPPESLSPFKTLMSCRL